MRPVFLTAIAFCLGFGSVAAQEIRICGNCDRWRPSQSLRQRIAGAQLVTILTATRSFDAANGDGAAITEFKVDQVLKAHAALGKQKTIQIPGGCKIDPKEPAQFLVLFDVAKDGKLNSHTGISTSPALVNYVVKAVALDAKDQPAQLRFFFDHLENADDRVAEDAWLELNRTKRADLLKVASKFSRVRLRAYLKSDDVSNVRKGLYVFLLGACGIDGDANLLKAMLDGKDPMIEEELLTGYVQLRPKEGWARMREILQNENAPFKRRYHALRATRYFHNERSDLVSKEETAAGVCLLLPHSDIADQAIEELRKWKHWEAATDILNLNALDSHAKVSTTRRAIIQYALSAKHLPAAKAFVEEQRRKDAEFVDECIELLKLENR